MILKRHFSNKKSLDIGFDIGLIAKGLFALGETICGIALIFLTPDRLNRLVSWVFGSELQETPKDWPVSHIVVFGHSFTSGLQHYAVIYLLIHGIIKLVVITLLWKKQLWAYPLSIVVLIGFIVYQTVQFAFRHSVLMLLMTILDIAVVVLTIVEYKNMRARKNGSGAETG